MILLSFCGYFFSLLISANAARSNDSNALCNCTNPVYIDQPLNIVQCGPKSKFYDQVNANFDIVKKFIDQKSAKHCDYTVYRKIINEMQKVILEIVDVYFSCTKRDCQPAIDTAFQKYVDVIVIAFLPYLACSYTYFTPECAVNIKHASFFSAENIMSTLTTCSSLKKSGQRPDPKLKDSNKNSKKPVDCNCVQIDARPIPVSEEQCYSPEYILTVKNFISVNFKRVRDTYRNASIANPECDYSTFNRIVNDQEDVASKMPDILKDSHPTFEKLTSLMAGITDLATETNAASREYILKNNKKCYFTPRQLRQSSMTITNYANQIMTKCVTFRDPKNTFCKTQKELAKDLDELKKRFRGQRSSCNKC